jgi:hypothetical protein
MLFIATTDSYIKWVNGLRLQLEPEWPSTMFLAKTLQNPSPRQTRVAVGENAASKVGGSSGGILFWKCLSIW